MLKGVAAEVPEKIEQGDNSENIIRTTDKTRERSNSTRTINERTLVNRE